MPLQLGRAFANASILVLGLASALLVWPALAQKPDAPAAPRMPSGFVGGADALLAKHYPQDAPGAVAIVVKDGRPVFRRAYGIADLEFGVLLEPDMVFRIGSVTKQFTAAAILQLADQGKLALDDEVTKHVDGYDTHGRRVTLEHLLTHTSGVPSYTDLPEWFPHVREELTPRQIVEMFGPKPLEFEPGSRFKYSNSGYLLLGLVIEKVSGRTVRRLHPSDGAAAWHAPDDVRRSPAGDPAAGTWLRARGRRMGERAVHRDEPAVCRGRPAVHRGRPGALEHRHRARAAAVGRVAGAVVRAVRYSRPAALPDMRWDGPSPATRGLRWRSTLAAFPGSCVT